MAANWVRVVGALVVVGAGAGSAAQAQQILTAVESRFPGPGVEPKDAKSSSVAGKALGTHFGGVDTRAVTDYGVNKVFVKGAPGYVDGQPGYRSYATSNWLDTYTVGGTPGSMVNLNFKFSIDGSINVPIDPYSQVTTARINYSIYALRGSGWTLSGSGPSAGPLLQSPLSSVDRYDDLLLQGVSPTLISQIQTTSFNGQYLYANTAGQPGAGIGHVTYDKVTDIFNFEQTLPNGKVRITTLSATGFKATDDGVSITGPAFLPYSYSPGALALRNNLATNNAILDIARLCNNSFNYCPAGTYPGSDLSVSFTLAAGSQFTLLSSLHANDLYEGTLDFYNTAKLTGVTVSPGGTLTSDSGALQQLAGGGYGYVPASGAVPEPASWALMIAGFGLTGTMLRRRRLSVNRVVI